MERWIIVGAGSAGCVLADRLSADGSRHITLLDDGPELLPGAVPSGVSGPNFFAALAEPGRSHLDLLARRTASQEPSLYQRGRGIGGSSAVNAMVALQGSEQIYQDWGWSDTAECWSKVKLVREPAADRELGAVDRALLAANTRAEQTLLTRRDARRVSSAEAYVWPARERENLQVRADSAVGTVRFDGRTATGVTLVDGTTLDADRVILAAGAIHTPVILLRSGVDTAGVGSHLQDHPSVVFALLLRNGTPHDPTGLPIASVLHTTIDNNLLQLLPMNNLGPDPESAGLGALMAALMTPVGNAGSVSIDGDGNPVVDFALLSDDRDVHALSTGVRLALDTLAHPAFQDIVEQAFIDDVGTTTAALDSDDAIAAWVRSNCADYVHATSTCAMGTVVDGNGAVAGYDQLFVCDASVFPSIPDANTHLPTTMLAERLSKRLLAI